MGDGKQKKTANQDQGNKKMNGLILQELTKTSMRQIADRFAGVIAGSVLERRSVYRTLQGKMLGAPSAKPYRN